MTAGASRRSSSPGDGGVRAQAAAAAATGHRRRRPRATSCASRPRPATDAYSKVKLTIEQEQAAAQGDKRGATKPVTLSFSFGEEEKVDSVAPDGSMLISARLVDAVGQGSAGTSQQLVDDMALAFDELKIQFKRQERGEVVAIAMSGLRRPLDESTGARGAQRHLRRAARAAAARGARRRRRHLEDDDAHSVDGRLRRAKCTTTTPTRARTAASPSSSARGATRASGRRARRCRSCRARARPSIASTSRPASWSARASTR